VLRFTYIFATVVWLLLSYTAYRSSNVLDSTISPHLKQSKGLVARVLSESNGRRYQQHETTVNKPPVVSPTPLQQPLPSNTYTPSAQPSYNPCDLLHTTLEPTQTPTYTHTPPPNMTLAEEFRSRNFSKISSAPAIGRA
jgi:hypothetical protein